MPYKDEALDREIMVNDGARRAIADAGAERFVSVIDPSNPKLVKLLQIMEAGWDSIGPLQERGTSLPLARSVRGRRRATPRVLPRGVRPRVRRRGALRRRLRHGRAQGPRLSTLMQRRPKTDFTMSKYNPLGRLHRDPDAIDYKSPGWMEYAMPNSRETDEEGHSYRYYNVWMARTLLDPSGQVWENPLCLLLPRGRGREGVGL